MASREQLLEARIDPDAVVFQGYTYIQLHQAFDKVQDSDNWKNPITAVVDPKELDATKAAIVFFTGGPVSFERTTRVGVTIHAKGYYHYTNEGA